jgi:hypothetical protein
MIEKDEVAYHSAGSTVQKANYSDPSDIKKTMRFFELVQRILNVYG